eukprot:5315997-Amphidinium_carterae.1
MPFAIALARSRIASQSWYSQGSGSMAALVLESEQTAVLARLKSLVASYAAAESQHTRFWTNLSQHNCLQGQCMQQLVQVASETDFVMSENLGVLARRYFCGVTHTKHVEEGVRSNKLAEISRSGCRQLASIRAWHTLVSERVPNLLHRCHAIDKARVDVPLDASTIH